MSSPSRRVVYTVLIGEYEKLNEQPLSKASAIPFVCLTDNPGLTSQTWQVQQVKPLFALDPIRSQRFLNFNAHRVFPQFDQSLYIDNALVLDQPPEVIFEQSNPDAGLAVPIHPLRERLLDEFWTVASTGLDEPGRILEQLNYYIALNPQLLYRRPYETCLLVRNHDHPRVVEAMELWTAHVLRFSRRDQLALNHVLETVGLEPVVCEINQRASHLLHMNHMGRQKKVRSSKYGAVYHSMASANLQDKYADLATMRDRLVKLVSLGNPLRVKQKTTLWRLMDWVIRQAYRYPWIYRWGVWLIGRFPQLRRIFIWVRSD